MEMDRITGQPQAVKAVVCKIATLSLALSIIFLDLSSLISYNQEPDQDGLVLQQISSLIAIIC